MKDPSIRAKSIKLLKQNTWINFYDIGIGNDFLNSTLKSLATKEK